MKKQGTIVLYQLKLMKQIEVPLFRLAAIICLAAASAQTASAQEVIDDNNGWDVRIGLPLWASGLEGTIGVRNRAVHIDDSFTDILDTLDFIAALNVEVRKSRWLFLAEGFYTKTSTSGEPRGLLSGTGAEVELEEKMAFGDLAIGYALVKNERFSLEAFAGAQLLWLEPKLTLQLPIAERNFSTSKFAADPIIGAFLNYRLSRRVGLYAKGDVGGFDVSSHLTWQVEGGLDIPLGHRFYCRLAYRYLDIDYDKGALSADIALHGPQLELGIRF
jgi:opacity protein-like surface antigen